MFTRGLCVLNEVKSLVFLKYTPTSSSYHLDQTDFNNPSVFFIYAINDIYCKFLVINKNHVAYHLNEQFNFCITSGVYANIFIYAQITPIHKEGLPQNPFNFIPASGLRNLRKIFENFFYNRLQNFCLTAFLLVLRKGNCITVMVALSFSYDFQPALEERKYATCVFYDYSACFDNLSCSILNEKLQTYLKVA